MVVIARIIGPQLLLIPLKNVHFVDEMPIGPFVDQHRLGDEVAVEKLDVRALLALLRFFDVDAEA